MENFYFITHEITDAYFNIASEEYLLKQKEGYYFYLWVNAPAVIVGVNQNTIEEVNLSFTEQNDIKVVRRMTGGGAVYHDLNNLCYTIIAPFDEKQDNYKKFTAYVIEYLNDLGVNATFSGRNDITVDGFKISGNAQTVYNDRIMHHGTLLFNTDMSVLEGALKPNKLKIQSKGIKSVRARVKNIYDALPTKMSLSQFKKGLRDKFSKIALPYEFTDEDLKQINKLVKEKYSTFGWNIGYSPKGKNTFEHKFDFGVLNINFDIINGKIENTKITGDFFHKNPIEQLESKLNGCTFDKKSVLVALDDVAEYIVNSKKEEIVNKLFC